MPFEKISHAPKSTHLPANDAELLLRNQAPLANARPRSSRADRPAVIDASTLVVGVLVYPPAERAVAVDVKLLKTTLPAPLETQK